MLTGLEQATILLNDVGGFKPIDRFLEIKNR